MCPHVCAVAPCVSNSSDLKSALSVFLLCLQVSGKSVDSVWSGGERVELRIASVAVHHH